MPGKSQLIYFKKITFMLIPCGDRVPDTVGVDSSILSTPMKREPLI